MAARLEPLLSARFSILPPVNIARYAKYPLGNGQPYHLRKFIDLIVILLHVRYIIDIVRNNIVCLKNTFMSIDTVTL